MGDQLGVIMIFDHESTINGWQLLKEVAMPTLALRTIAYGENTTLREFRTQYMVCIMNSEGK